MASFNNTIITTKGHALMAKIVAGTATPSFTKIRTSDNVYAGGTNFEALTSLLSVKQTVDVASVTRVSPAKIKVSGVFTNEALVTGYYVRNIGLYAIDPQDGEILYSVTQAVEADWMPPQGGVSASSILVDIETVVSNSSNINMTVNPNASATVQMLNDLTNALADVKGFVGYNEADVYGVEVNFKTNTFTRLAGALNKIPGADFNSIRAFGGRRRCNLADNGTVNVYYGGAGYIENGSNGQVMVEQPKFYYKVVPLELEKRLGRDVDNFVITAAATSNGNVTITLDGVSFNVAVTTADNTATLVATKIRNAEFTGWTTGGSGTTVTFTCNIEGPKAAATFNGGTTGVTATVTNLIPGYFAKGFSMRKARFYVSDTHKPGFKVHPAFVRNNVEVDKIYLAAYEGSIQKANGTYVLDDAQTGDFTAVTGDKLASISSAKPASGVTQDLYRSAVRTLASNRGVGWQQKDVLTVSASQMLMMIEYNTMNMQTAIARGVVDKVDDAVSSMTELTGATTNLGNTSGAAAGTNGLVSVSYRGEENFWGNIWQWVDGLNINIDATSRKTDAFWASGSFADNSNSGTYKDVGYSVMSYSNGSYISAFGWSEACDFLFLPTEVSGSSALPVGDAFFNTATGWRVPRLGGSWDLGSQAGSFSWIATSSSASRSRSIGGGAVYVPQVA